MNGLKDHNGDLLLSVEKPSRYTGGEVNAIRREKEGCRLRFALAFPDTYEVGMSHLGLQILYAVLNDLPEVSCERCFAPWPDMEQRLREQGAPLRSLETRRPLHAFDVVGFSLQYELSYTNVLSMLDLGGIPLHREERRDWHPLVIAGGPCAFNPAPMTPFIDAFVIGEGEEVAREIAATLTAQRREGTRREGQLEALASVSGVYVPSVHGQGVVIRKRIVADLDTWQLPLCPVVPLMNTIHDRVTIEIARGCTRGCRFCQAGMIWRPVREREPSVVARMAEAMLSATGHDEISLLSLSSGDYTAIGPLLTALVDRYYRRRVALALPSLRVETLKSGLIEAIRRIRKTSFTLAPEAGTQRLRDVINKGNTEEELLATTSHIFSAGWKAVKLYFMLGLPTERQEDLEGIVDLALKVLRTTRGRGQVTVSLSTFVPKPHTPFQWRRQIGIEEIEERQGFFRRHLKNRNISVKWHDARMSLLEGIISRGGEEVGEVIETAYGLGCRFDGWSDRLRFDLWEEAFRRKGTKVERYLAERQSGEPLPWDHIDSGVSRAFLASEDRKAQRGETTADCRRGNCLGCGVCDQRLIKVKTVPADSPLDGAGAGPAPIDTTTERTIRLCFTKLGPARYLSHLEISSALVRAMLRADMPFVYSQGFHPHPRISFGAATAVGMESKGEFVDCRIYCPAADADQLLARINAGLPQGIEVRAMQELPARAFTLAELIKGFDYRLVFPSPLSDEEMALVAKRIAEFQGAERFEVKRDGKAAKDIRPLVLSILLDKEGRHVHLSTEFGASGTVKPAEVITAVLGLSPQLMPLVRIIKEGTRIAPFASEKERDFFRPAQ